MATTDKDDRTAGKRGVKRRAKWKTVVGWREWVGLPDLRIERIKAKVDTGARTSALHAFDLETFTHRGSPHVGFNLHPVQRKKHPEIACVAEIRDKRAVVSSNGQREERIVILTTARIDGQDWPIELTLTNRDQMGFRMLLGREALRGRFVVDPGASFLTKS